MNTLVRIVLILLFSSAVFQELQAKKVVIVAVFGLEPHAEILRDYLQKSYINDDFVIDNSLPQSEDAVVFHINTSLGKEEFDIRSNEKNGRIILTISAGGKPGLSYAVFQLLEEFGFGFFLSFETIPEKPNEINLEGIHISDKPLTPQRIVFNWHNFLSGCSSWDIKEWKHYIDQSSKMRFNGLMTHFYANDPTFVFSHNGVEKVPGFMPNTQKGRQYGTQQVNDARRLVAGDVFEGHVFGSNASKVADEDRVAAARELMQTVHNYASSKYMDVWFGLDIDAQLANPQEIMNTLPESAKIKVKQKPNKYFGTPDSVFYLPVPDSPGGSAYYKSMLIQLFEQFPEIDNIVLWTRTSGSPFLTLTYEDFPARWKQEFDQIAATNQKIDKNNANITGRFATGKIYKTVRKVLHEIGKDSIKLWAGSWRTTWLEQADWFYPKEVGFIPLDYHVDYFRVEEKYRILKNVAENREIIPIVWAHHDDGAFIGSPYRPYKNLQSKVASLGNSGIGVIHWTTKPLDIYFKNTEQKFRTSTKNAGLQHSAGFLAKRMVEPKNKNLFTNYLVKWVEEGPGFGRETRTWFIDHKITETDYKKTIGACNSRLKILKGIDEPTNKALQYFTGLEEFCIDFYHTQYNYQKALEACNLGDYRMASQYLSACKPEKVIEKYAHVSKLNDITLGEKGVVLEMNLSWLPLINSLRQTLRQQPVYWNFGTVNFPDLGVGLLNTNYLIDKQKRLWRNLGEDETGSRIVTTQQDSIEEPASKGILPDKKQTINIEPFAVDVSPRALKNPDYFLAGKYTLTLLFSRLPLQEENLPELEIYTGGASGNKSMFSGKIDKSDWASGKYQFIEKKFQLDLKENSSIRVKLIKKKGTCVLNALVLTPEK